MATLITVDDIVLLLGETVDSDGEDVIQMYIDFAVGELEAWLGRPISIQDFEEYVIADASGRIYLRNTPVVEVTSVTIDDQAVTEDGYVVTPWGLEAVWSWPFSGVVSTWELDDEPTALTDPEVIVNYSAGLDTPVAINSLIAAGVIRKWKDRASLISKTEAGADGVKEIKVEDYAIKYETGSEVTSSTYSTGASPILIFRSEADFLPIKRLKRRAIG